VSGPPTQGRWCQNAQMRHLDELKSSQQYKIPTVCCAVRVLSFENSALRNAELLERRSSRIPYV
ncbi:MAG TPA: hypothetical protein PLY87_07970, partial [Planctomycetaceae bacterium]|nr:hypothetical protein [Planctomycetaceae bacterium]